MVQMIISSKVSFWFAKEITLQQRNSGVLTKEIRNNMLCKQKHRKRETVFFSPRRNLRLHAVDAACKEKAFSHLSFPQPKMHFLKF